MRVAFRNRFFGSVQGKVKSYMVKMDPNPVWLVFSWEKDKRGSCVPMRPPSCAWARALWRQVEVTVVSVSQKMPRIASVAKNQVKFMEHVLPRTLTRKQPCWDLDSRLLASINIREYFSCFQLPSLGSLLLKPPKTNTIQILVPDWWALLWQTP